VHARWDWSRQVLSSNQKYKNQSKTNTKPMGNGSGSGKNIETIMKTGVTSAFRTAAKSTESEKLKSLQGSKSE
jgi:hypothetical protein